MYASDLVVGARSLQAVDRALREALPGLGLTVTEAIDVANVSERYERRGDETSISVGDLGEGIYAIAVRGPRAPRWNNELARRVSRLLGGWAATFVSDRLHDDYGYGYYLDGLTVEAAVRDARRVIERAGFLPETPDRVVFDLLDEERNGRNFATALTNLAGPYVSGWPPSGAIRVLFIAGEGAVIAEDVRPPSSLVLAAGHEARIDLPGFEYEIVVLNADVRVLVARTELPHWEIAERLEAEPCDAFFTDGAAAFVKRRADDAVTEVPFANLRTALVAWAPICAATRTAPMAFTFDVVRPATPWR